MIPYQYDLDNESYEDPMYKDDPIYGNSRNCIDEALDTYVIFE